MGGKERKYQDKVSSPKNYLKRSGQYGIWGQGLSFTKKYATVLAKANEEVIIMIATGKYLL